MSLIAVAAVLAGCGSSAAAELTTAPPVTGNGKHYSYSVAHVPRSQWPSACTVLPSSAVAAALQAPVQTKRFHTQCLYQPTDDVNPTVTLTLNSLGTAAPSEYENGRPRGKDASGVEHVGRDAVRYAVPHLPATALDVSTAYAYFTVTVQPPYSKRSQRAAIEELLVRLGRVVAKEFSA